MKSFMGLLCLFCYSAPAHASEDYIVNATVSAKECEELSGTVVCISQTDSTRKNIVVALSDCDPQEDGGMICTGTWEGDREFNGHVYSITVWARKASFPGLDGNPAVNYDLNATLKVDGAHETHVHLNTGERAGITDTVQIDGEEFAPDSRTRITPGFSIGPALP